MNLEDIKEWPSEGGEYLHEQEVLRKLMPDAPYWPNFNTTYRKRNDSELLGIFLTTKLRKEKDKWRYIPLGRSVKASNEIAEQNTVTKYYEMIGLQNLIRDVYIYDRFGEKGLFIIDELQISEKERLFNS